ncbi:MAG: DUF1858 domain-containing protein [Nitrospinota bacterium]
MTKIDKNSKIGDILKNVPNASRVFALYDMGCAACQGREHESLEWGANMHGIKLDKFIADLKKAKSKKSK